MDNRAFWKYMINAKTKSTNCGIASLHANHLDVNSILVDNNKEKANILNKYFASVYNTLKSQMGKSQPYLQGH